MSRTLPELVADARSIRRAFLKMHYEARAGHVGTGLSDIDLLTYVYGAWLRPQDTFILSKGHGASSLYATLHHFGRLSDADFGTYYKDGTLLPAHPAARALPAIPAATGSLGHGLPISAGIAYAHKHVHGSDARVTCLVSDGECDEGSVWEAALFSAHHGLDNLTVIVDANGLQGFGRTEEVMKLEPLPAKWAAFGFRTSEIDGHDVSRIAAALEEPGDGRPHCIVARTTKGKGVRFMEDRLEWHYLPMSEVQYREAVEGLGDRDDARGGAGR
ncbi:MAG TPA: transketolase [Polyangiaceae bacterium]|jgi:transketolase|nr:transketolase [Polyangiaceae bacterium]